MAFVIVLSLFPALVCQGSRYAWYGGCSGFSWFCALWQALFGL